MVKSEEYASNLTKGQVMSDVEYIKGYGWAPYLMVQGINSTIVVFNKEPRISQNYESTNKR